jgi:hypothetical protein
VEDPISPEKEWTCVARYFILTTCHAGISLRYAGLDSFELSYYAQIFHFSLFNLVVIQYVCHESDIHPLILLFLNGFLAHGHLNSYKIPFI